MSLITLSSLERITAPKLAELLLAADTANTAEGGSIAVVDVRDDDHIGGHIRSSLHFPSQSLDAMMPTLMRKLADKETVIFHCALSQQRGPGAALQYLREKEATGGNGGNGGSGGEKATETGAKTGGKKAQRVYVLDRGFVGWQESYGLDRRLTEAYRKELWEDGY
ncbi:hypothetical protein E0Z10_g10681 [Xylaria hypoxylon]|uniref:Rhodanese domain-containing protein n=1 Tax=Xylaria hypoxylon TaxID=37992 RepID=A0A4Z0Y1H9_9PEZI|nr:hypothetical protein E0Z10_g10681 [Xylaria hypoxylon]